MMHIVEMNAAQMKFIREFFDNYSDEKVKLTIKDESKKIKVVYEAETDLTTAELQGHLKSEFKTKSKYANALYYTINIK